MKSLTKRKNMASKDFYYAEYTLDQKINAQYISREEQIQNTEFIDKVATRNFGTEHSAKWQELAEYRSKVGFSEELM